MPQAQKTRSGGTYDEAQLRAELDALGDEVAALGGRISLVGYKLAANDDNYTYNLLDQAEGAMHGALALVQKAELQHLAGRSLLEHVIAAREAAVVA